MRYLLLFLALVSSLASAQGSTVLSLAEAESLWQQHSRELRLARSAVSGGLISATILTLFVLPAQYYFVATHPRQAKALH